MNDVVSAADAAGAALSAMEGGAPLVVVAAISPSGSVRRILVDDRGDAFGTLRDAHLQSAALRLATRALESDASDPLVESITLDGEAWTLFAEAHRPTEHLLIVGAGHIAVPLAHLARMLDFRVTVLDDREEFATSDRFDDDVAVLQTDFAGDPFGAVTLTQHTWIALVTRGHKWDFDCLQRVIAAKVKPRYIGMIGSRRRVRAAFTALLAAGTPRDVLATIRAPIGIELQGETPAEIAVSIAAELIAVRRGAEAGSISARERVLDRYLQEQE